MRLLSALTACLLLAGCVKMITGPDGQPAYFTRCSGQACFTRMAEQCPRGYDIISDVPVVIGNAAGGVGFVNSARDLAFSCRG